MRVRTWLLVICCGFVTLVANAFTNPIIYADYSDPDVIRVGDEYFMTASSFNCSPGLPVLHSYNLVDWELLGHALPDVIPGGVGGLSVEHGNQVWAPSFRYHKKTFYITWGDPDTGIWQVHATDPKGPWSAPHLIVAAKGYIDACPFWDEKGHTFIVHALAGSRAGLKSVLLLMEVDEALTKVVTPSQIIFDGHLTQPTCEGPKLYKKGRYYYIFFPAGGVATGWQTVLRSTMLYSHWEEKIVMKQGSTDVNGPHQGGWVTTPNGEDWFIHFQDVGALGRILHLQPMSWKDDWPVVGEDKDGDGVGEPVAQYCDPQVGKKKDYYVEPIGQTIFTVGQTWTPSLLGTAWQWQAAPSASWYQLNHCAIWDKATEDKLLSSGSVRLYSRPQEGDNLWMQPNMLMQKITGPNADYRASLMLDPTDKYTGERGGVLVFGTSYAGLVLENTEDGVKLYYVECNKADKGAAEMKRELATLSNGQVWVRVRIKSEDAPEGAASSDKIVTAAFEYCEWPSPNEPLAQNWLAVDSSFLVQPGKWIGAKVGVFCTRPQMKINDGGWLDMLEWRSTYQANEK